MYKKSTKCKIVQLMKYLLSRIKKRKKEKKEKRKITKDNLIINKKMIIIKINRTKI
jgi:hypothetical protein